MRRLEREVRTVRLMIGLYCRRHHGVKGPCGNCRELASYAERRIGKCPFGEEKPACGRCTIHCYKPEMKARIREVMRFAGPRMTWRHPLLAIRHLFSRWGSRHPLGESSSRRVPPAHEDELEGEGVSAGKTKRTARS